MGSGCHGSALNVNPDLVRFADIVPCGIGADDGSATSMHAELGHEADFAGVKPCSPPSFGSGSRSILKPLGR
jgi:lipoate-protein ligase B